MISEIYNSNDLPGDPNLHSDVGANALEFTEPAALSPVLSFQRPFSFQRSQQHYNSNGQQTVIANLFAGGHQPSEAFVNWAWRCEDSATFSNGVEFPLNLILSTFFFN